MKRLAVATAFVLSLATSAFAADWAAVAPKLRDSVVEISITTDEGQGACTGFVIDNERDFVLTAAHCDGKVLYVDNLKAEVKAKDDKRDLMVLYVKDIDRPALKLAKKAPNVGDEVASFGYGFALEQPLMRVTHISAKDIAIERARYTVVDAVFVGGQSGGPVVNTVGEVVMIVQLGGNGVGLGVDSEIIDDKVGRFFSKP
jgi:S1-C subfamily serine protease